MNPSIRFVAASLITLAASTAVAAPAKAPTLKAFDKMSNRSKMRALVQGFDKLVPSESWGYDLKPAFRESAVRLKTALKGATLAKALKIYTKEKIGMTQAGGDKPDIGVIRAKGMKTPFAYTFSGSGRSYGNWAYTGFYDRNFKKIGVIAGSD